MSEKALCEVNMTYATMRSYFRAAERARQHLSGFIVFSPASFDKEYSVESRTYAVSSDNKAFRPNMGGYSIYASSLDGSDPCVRLEQYMASEYGGKNGWQIERCYMMSDEVERAITKRPSPHALTRRRRGGWRYCLSKQRICPYRFRLTGACRPYDPAKFFPFPIPSVL